MRDVSPLEERDLRVSWAKSRQLIAASTALASVEGRDLAVHIGLSLEFPSELPQIFIADPEALGFLPHVEEKTGWVCYKSPEGLSVSLRKPERVLELGVSLALEVLADGLSGRNRGDIADEIEAYWRDFGPGSPVPSFITPDGRLRLVTLGRVKRDLKYVADDFSQVRAVIPKARRASAHHRLIYIPLPAQATRDIDDPRSLRAPDALSSLIATHLPDADQKHVSSLLKSRDFPLAVLGLMRSDGSRSLVAIHYPGAKGHPLVSKKKSGRRGRLIALSRRDRGVLRARGGASQRRLGTMRIAVLGCGSVGGYIAALLAKAGVGELVLVDPEKLTYENTFRHLLGAGDVGCSKAKRLKEQLERAVPYLKVRAFEEGARSAFDQGHVDPAKVHFVVVAIGNPTENRLVNAQLHKADVPAVYSWLEPMGIGGHALLAGGGAGCLECLFVDEEGAERLTARSDFAAPGQHFARDVTGCASVFTPYGDVDAQRTANLTTRLAVDALLERETRSALQSWKGSANEFEAAGFALSPRFTQTIQELEDYRYDLPHEHCPICGAHT